MSAENYNIAPGACNQWIITGDASAMKLHVYELRGHTFKTNPEEIQFYANDRGQLYAFETEAWQDQQLPRITSAITWFAGHIGNPDMEITIEPKKFHLKPVK